MSQEGVCFCGVAHRSDLTALTQLTEYLHGTLDGDSGGSGGSGGSHAQPLYVHHTGNTDSLFTQTRSVRITETEN